MIFGVQLIGILFGLIMIYLTYIYYKRGSYNGKSLALWTIIWLGFMTIITIPETIYGVMQALHIERTADFLVMSGFLLFSILTFYLYMNVKKTNSKVEQLVRSIALQEKNTKKKIMRKYT